MKALITAGGLATRLRPVTHTINKHLIPIANKPMIHYAIEAVHEAGVSQIGIVVNPPTMAEIKNQLQDGRQFGVKIEYIIQEAPKGLAHVVKVAESFLGHQPFVFYLGDNILVGGIKKFITTFKEKKSNCHLLLAKVPDPERFGVPTIKGGKIVQVEEKPKKPKSNYAITGIYVYDHHIFEAVKSIKPSARGELEISDAHQWLLDHGYKITFSETTGWWKDTGKPEDLLESNHLILDKILPEGQDEILGQIDKNSNIAGKVKVAKTAKIINSKIRGPVIIGQNVVIENSYIGPFTSIYDDCRIKDSEVEYSILLSGVTIEGVPTRVEKSLLGSRVILKKCRGLPKTNRFVVGDQSLIELV